MKKQYNVIAIILLLIMQNVLKAQVIVMSFNPYPGTPTEHTLKKFVGHLKEPHRISQYMLTTLESGALLDGIFSTYVGFVETSDNTGLTVYPRKHDTPTLTLIITQRITPITINQNTVHHWQINPDFPAQGYQYNQKKNAETSLSFWDVQPLDTCTMREIPLEALIIFANPNKIYVPVGITPTLSDGPNLILPPIYIKTHVDTVQTGLFVLDIAQYFRNLTFLKKKTPLSFSLRID